MNFCRGNTSGNTIKTKYFSVKLAASDAKNLPSEVTIGIRPEKTFIKESKAKNAHDIQVIEPLGREKLIYLDARTDEKFVSLMTSEAATQINDDISVSVSVDAKDIFIFDLDGNRLK